MIKGVKMEILICTMLLVLSFAAGVHVSDKWWRKDLVKRNYAEYVGDVNGNARWQWKN